MFLACSQFMNATTWGRESLKGLTTFSVSAVMEPPCKQVMVVDRIHTDVELRLRSVGLPIKQNAQNEEGGASINVSVGCVPVIYGGRTIAWAVAYTVALIQAVDLHAARTPALAETWSLDATIVGTAASIEGRTRSGINDSVDEFLNDYFTVNPKK
jgi:hypothetical protein